MLNACVIAVEQAKVRMKVSFDPVKELKVRRPMHRRYALVPNK
jgi:hypothetical protein